MQTVALTPGLDTAYIWPLLQQEEKLQDEVKEFEDEEFSILEALSQLDVENEEEQKDLILTKKKLDRKISARKVSTS